MNRALLYREEFIDYLKDRKIFSSFLNFTRQPPETFKTADEIVRIRSGGKFKNLQEYGKWFSVNKTFAPLRKVDIPGTNPSAYSFLDLSDVPMFQWQSGSLLTNYKESLFKISASILISILLFYLSFISFIKYDVR